MIYLCTVLYINKYPRQGLPRGGGKSSESIAGGEGIRRKGKGKVAGRKTFSYLLFLHFSSLFLFLPACCSRVRAVCPACLRRKHRSEGLVLRWWKTRYNCGSRRPSRHASRPGVGRGNTLAAAASAVHEKPTFFFLFRPSFLLPPLRPVFLRISLIVLRPLCYWSAGEWSAGDVIQISRAEYVYGFLEISENLLQFFDRIDLFCLECFIGFLNICIGSNN